MAFAHHTTTAETSKPPALRTIPVWVYFALLAAIAIGNSVYRLTVIGPTVVNWAILALTCLFTLLFAAAMNYFERRAPVEKEEISNDIKTLEHRIEKLSSEIQDLPDDLTIEIDDQPSDSRGRYAQ
jgi:hypothetical protein